MQNDQSEDLNRFQKTALKWLQKSIESDWFKGLQASNEARRQRLTRQGGHDLGLVGAGFLVFGALCLLMIVTVLDHPLTDIFAYAIVGFVFIGLGWHILRK